MTNIFKPNYQHYEGVRPINIYVLRLFFVLMFLMLGYSAWTEVFTHTEAWEPLEGVTWCVWAAYATLAIFGIYNTLKMLPLLLFMIFYKVLWLVVVALPLWRANSLEGSSAEELTSIFIWAIIPLVFFPFKYFFNTYILPTKR